jgi:hypothetical protein
MMEPTNEFPKFTLADIAADEERIADTGMTEVPTLNPEPDDSGEFDIADDQLICDTGMMKIPAAFRPDPDLDITPSQLAHQGDRSSVNDDDDLPTLSPVADDMPAATTPQPDDEDDAPDTEDLVSLEAEPTAIFEKPEFELPPSDDLSEMPKIEKIRHSIADAERAATRASATEPALEPAEAAPSASMSPARPTQAATAHQRSAGFAHLGLDGRVASLPHDRDSTTRLDVVIETLRTLHLRDDRRTR